MNNIKYINHLGECVYLDRRPYYANINDLRDYNWSNTNNGIRITGISRLQGIVTHSLIISVYATSVKNATDEKNILYDLFEKDTATNQYGKLYIGDYYLKCFVTGAKKSGYSTSGQRLTVEFTVTTDMPIWYKSTVHLFRALATSESNIGLTYPHDYPFGYATANGIRSIINDGFTPCGFELRIYGACSNPTVKIGGQVYSVKCDVATGEILTITSIGEQKTIVLYAKDGSTTNEFNNRDKVNDCFAKIAVGQNDITWDNNFNFDLVMVDERGEPKWT